MRFVQGSIPDDVRALAEHPPDEVVRELVAAEDLVRPEAEPAVDDRDRNPLVRLGGDLVLEDLLDEAASGRLDDVVSLHGVVAARLDRRRGYEQLRPLVDDGPADVDVVEEHVGGAVVADVHDLVAGSGDATRRPAPRSGGGAAAARRRPPPAAPRPRRRARTRRRPSARRSRRGGRAGSRRGRAGRRSRSASAGSGTARPCPRP